jgi:methionine-rich copper-binding protein CopC/putative copper export protein
VKRTVQFAQLVIAALLLLAMNVADVFAHATPMVYEPGASAVLEKIPPRIRIQFSEHIEPTASSITIYAPDGSRADTKDSRLDPADLRVLSVGIRDAGQGVYTVSWQVVSQDDGHFTKGGFSFGVGKDAVPAHSSSDQIQVGFSSPYSQAGAIGLELVGQSMFLAVLIAIAILWRALPSQKITAPQRAAFERSCKCMVGVGAALITVGVVVFLILKTLDLEGSRATTFVSTLQTFIGTVDGRYAAYRLILGAAFGMYFFATRKRIFASSGLTLHEGVLAGLLALTLLDRARVSHAAASHFHPEFSILMNAVHLLAKEFWVGGLLALSLILMPILNRIGRAPWIALTLASMSKYISAALALTGVTGAYIVWLHLKSPAYILTTPWGMRFIVLSALAAVLSLLRLYNLLFPERYAVWACRQHLNGYRREALRWLQYSIPFEMCVGVALLFVTSYLIITTPPYPSERYALEKRASSQGAVISLTVHPVEQKQFLITVTDEKTGAAVPVSEGVVTLENSEKNIGPLVPETDERFPGGFTFPRNSLSVPGRWDIAITARRSGTYDAAVSIPLEYPAELDASRIGPDARAPGLFEGILVFVAVAAVLFSLAVFLFERKQISRCTGIEESRGWSQPGFKVSRSLLATVPATVVVCTVIWISSELFAKSSFELLCESHGDVWTQSVPMRAGVTLASETMAVCSTSSNDFHFADIREYTQFLEKAPAAHEHHHHN